MSYFDDYIIRDEPEYDDETDVLFLGLVDYFNRFNIVDGKLLSSSPNGDEKQEKYRYATRVQQVPIKDNVYEEKTTVHLLSHTDVMLRYMKYFGVDHVPMEVFDADRKS